MLTGISSPMEMVQRFGCSNGSPTGTIGYRRQKGPHWGPDSGYLRVTAISCFGCNFPSDQQWNCGEYMPANGATTFPPPPSDFTIPGEQGEENKMHLS